MTCCSPWGCRVRHYLVTEQQHGASVSFDLKHFLALCSFAFVVLAALGLHVACWLSLVLVENYSLVAMCGL